MEFSPPTFHPRPIPPSLPGSSSFVLRWNVLRWIRPSLVFAFLVYFFSASYFLSVQSTQDTTESTRFDNVLYLFDAASTIRIHYSRIPLFSSPLRCCLVQFILFIILFLSTFAINVYSFHIKCLNKTLRALRHVEIAPDVYRSLSF